MSQNIYDDPAFFERYSQMRRSTEGLEAVAEWPALRAMLPPMAGLDIVDLGCGMGWFSRWARGAGAASVLGLDLSEKMLERARAMSDDAAIRYERTDLEQLVLPHAAFDLAHSSLAFHYIADAGRLYRTVHQALRAGGWLVFSTEHPIYMAPSHPGFVEGDQGPLWPLNSYAEEGPRVTDWLAKGVVKQHRMLATTLNLLIEAGFQLRRIEEFHPTLEQVAEHPEFAAERQRPIFLLIAAQA